MDCASLAATAGPAGGKRLVPRTDLPGDFVKTHLGAADKKVDGWLRDAERAPMLAGFESVADLEPNDPRVRYVRAPRHRDLDQKRNAARVKVLGRRNVEAAVIESEGSEQLRN